MLHLKKKERKKNTCKYHDQNLDMIYSSWDTEQSILKLLVLGHFLPFYPLKTPKIKILENEKNCWRYHHFTHGYLKSQSYNVWFPRYEAWWTDFFVILGHFLPFYHPSFPLIILKIKILKKEMEAMSRDIILSYIICTIIEDHMIYASWNIRCDRQNFLLFWAIFCPFRPLTNQIIKILKLKKTPGDIIIVHIFTINENHR